jgi:hypothetical protein
MLTAITYNCDPASLGDVPHEDFVDAFENEVRARPCYRELSVRVTFDPAANNGVTVFASDDWQADISHEEQFREEFKELAEKAFNHCCR